MAESEFVSAAQFGEFVKRMEDRFEAVDKRFAAVDKRVEEGFAHANQLADQRYDSINQRLADAEKAREQDLVHVNQRFDDTNRSMNQRFDDTNRSMDRRFDSLEKMIAWQNRITMGILLVILAAAVKYLFIPG